MVRPKASVASVVHPKASASRTGWRTGQGSEAATPTYNRSMHLPRAWLSTIAMTTIAMTTTVAMTTLLAGCPWFKSDSTKEQELRAAPEHITRSLRLLRARFPRIVAALDERWRSAKVRFDRARQLDETAARVRAMRAVLEPVSEPLNALAASERHYRGIVERLAQPSQLPKARLKAIRAHADAARRALLDWRPGAGALPALATTERTLSKLYFELQDAAR